MYQGQKWQKNKQAAAELLVAKEIINKIDKQVARDIKQAEVDANRKKVFHAKITPITTAVVTATYHIAVYRDCRLDADSLRNYNSLITEANSTVSGAGNLRLTTSLGK